MSSSISTYFRELGSAIDGGWRSFWYRPISPHPMARLRVVVALFSLYAIISFTPDLTTWFAADGLLPRGAVSRLVTGFGQEPVYRFSLFQLDDDVSYLWFAHGMLACNALLLLFGRFARITSVVNLIGLLTYVHRAPMLTGPFDCVLTMMAAYLCIAPGGGALVPWGGQAGRGDTVPSVASNIGLRLTQVHLSALTFVIGLNMLGGESWWTGDSFWWLAARPETRLVDLTGLLASSAGLYIVNGVTHAIVAYHLLYGVLIWQRLARPLLVLLAIPFWLMMVAMTGQIGYCLLMLAANLAFVSGPTLGSLFAIDGARGTH